MNLISFIKAKKILSGITFAAIVVGVTAFFDITLALGMIMLIFLSALTFLLLSKTKIISKPLLMLVLVTFVVHFGIVLFVHYANFQPFSGGQGDYQLYDATGKIIAERVHQGNFSTTGPGLYSGHIYPVIIGYIYALSVPDMFMGQLLDVWLAVISAILVFLIVLEMGCSKKQAFFTGLVVCFYPSYMFFGSLLLKDTLVIPLVLGALLLSMKLIKDFSWKNFAIFYVILLTELHFRFYVGYAVLIAFISCWFLLCEFNFRKKIICGLIMVILLGFSPQILGHGYYGFKDFREFISAKTITSYRQDAYIPSSVRLSTTAETPKIENSKTFINKIIGKIFPNIGGARDKYGATIEVKTEISRPLNFLINIFQSFIFALLGPFPWQIQRYSQLFVLIETIPWYFLLFFVIRGAITAFRRNRVALPLLVFSIMLFGVLALFVPNFGITTRIRMPAFVALCCLIPLGLGKLKFPMFSRADKYLDKYIF